MTGSPLLSHEEYVGKQYILTIDQGTSSTRALLVTKRGSVKAIAQRPLPTHYPKPGWVEHDPVQIWETTQRVIEEVTQKAGISLHDIVSLGITNQRETIIVWDKKTGKPLAPAIVWQDRRTAPRCQELKEHEAMIKQKTGLLLDPYFSATKIEWLLKQVGTDVLVGTVDSYLVWKLTGGKLHITDATNASRTMLLNIHTGAWDSELLKLFNIPRHVLPEVRNSSEIYGTTTHGIPISGIAGDQQAALFGQGCASQGDAKITFGTGCFVLVNTGSEPLDSKGHLLTTIGLQMQGKRTYALEGSVFIGGAAVQWLRDSLGIIKRSKEVEALASSVPDSHGLCFVPAFTGLGAPHWKPNAQGMILGITRGTTKAHLARATLEGIAHQVADVVEAIDIPIHAMKVDGGAIENALLLQIQSDYLGLPLLKPKHKELSALGAAFLSGLASGFWGSEAEVHKLWKKEREFLPAMDTTERHREKERWERAIYCASLWES